MYDIRQFRPALYCLLLLGFVGYALAAQVPGTGLLAIVLTLLNAWLVTNNKFRPLPRLVANLVTLLFTAFLVVRIRQFPGPPILAIGEFLIFLQLVKLYEQRGNRDIAQLLILSLLLMVAAAISTGSLLFGVLFIIYLFLSLYCCLLFHLKSETDHAKSVMGIDESKLNPATLKQDQRFLGRSMRRLTLCVSAVSIAMAIAVFLLFPRGSGAGIIGNIAYRPSEAMTGFSDQVSFQDVARITQNETEVAKVKVTRNGEPWGTAGEILYLRGSAPDTYVSDINDPDRWKWLRSGIGLMETIPELYRGQEHELDPVTQTDLFRQEIKLMPTGTNILFAMPGLVSINPAREMRLTWSKVDGVLQLIVPLTGEFPYVATSTGISPDRESIRLRRQPFIDLPKHYDVPSEIQQFALRDEVAGVDESGNLARRRLGLKNRLTDLDEQLARNFEHYLQTQFTYTLDLTDVRRVADKDPIVQFLYDFKRGHCEYFAGAMTLMCQSVGMKARMVVGFKCDEFNSVGNYFTVRQSHAHAWVEVLTPDGWKQFDPTAFRESNRKREVGAWRKFMNFLDYLDYTWGNAVVNYDSEDRTNLIQNVDSTLTNTAIQGSAYMSQLQQWFDIVNFYRFSSGLISLIMLIAVATIALALVYFLFERLKLNRRARRIGLEQLPGPAQKRLARQLAFYDALLQALDRRNISRPAHLTPMEFSRSMGFLPGDLYSSIQRLTRVFYRVRYGDKSLGASQQRRLMRVVERVDEALGPVKA